MNEGSSVLNDKSESVESLVHDGGGDAKRIRKRPNFFLGFPVDNPEIHRKVKKLQVETINRNPKLHSALVNVATLHVTLAVIHLKNEEDVKTVKNKLDIWEKEDKKLFFQKPVILNFSGTNTFDNTVAYVDLEKCENYQKVCDLSKNLNALLVSAGFSTDNKPTTPHLTIFKLSKDYKLLRNKKNFKDDFNVFKECSDNFGRQEVHKIQLLSMDEPKCENGYYRCVHQIIISEKNDENDHSECCQSIPKPEKEEKKANEGNAKDECE